MGHHGWKKNVSATVWGGKNLHVPWLFRGFRGFGAPCALGDQNPEFLLFFHCFRGLAALGESKNIGFAFVWQGFGVGGAPRMEKSRIIVSATAWGSKKLHVPLLFQRFRGLGAPWGPKSVIFVLFVQGFRGLAALGESKNKSFSLVLQGFGVGSTTDGKKKK